MQIHHKAFSLVEMMLAIALLSILSGAYWGADIRQYYQHWQSRQDLAQHSDALIAAIERARTLAISSDRQVFMCGGIACDGRWGEAVYLTYDLHEPPLWRQHLSSTIDVRWSGFPQHRSHIIFLPTGLSSYQNGSFYLCDAQTNARRVVINQSGRAYLDSTLYSSQECL